MATHSNILARRIPIDRGAWWATVHGVTKSRTRLTKHSTHSTHSLVWQFPFLISQFFPDSTFRATGLTKKFIRVFPNHVMGKPEQPFWPTHTNSLCLGLDRL